MLRLVLHRMLLMIPTLLVISLLLFMVIMLPPGDFLSNKIMELKASGEASSIAQLEFYRQEFDLDKPFLVQFGIWLGLWPGHHGFSGLLQGNWGWSFVYERPVSEVVGETVLLTTLLNFAVVLFIYAVSFPLGLYAATRPYSWGDYGLSLVGYLGLALPNFLLGLVLLYYFNKWFGVSIGGMMNPDYLDQPWSWAKIQSVLSHLAVPVIVIGTAGTAEMIRRLRANLMDELQKPYVRTARAKGLSETRVLVKYPLRMALSPFIADIGNLLPRLVSGSVIVSVVLSLPTIGPVLLTALMQQDQYLAGFILLFVAILTIVGMTLSDLLLAWVDPRIRMGQGMAR